MLNSRKILRQCDSCNQLPFVQVAVRLGKKCDHRWMEFTPRVQIALCESGRQPLPRVQTARKIREKVIS